jgi:hypothetical protein
MIVRILTDNQYRLDDAHMTTITRLDHALEDAAAKEDALQFSDLLEQLTTFIRERGQVIPDNELVVSQLVVPPADMTMAEARKYFEENDI